MEGEDVEAALGAVALRRLLKLPPEGRPRRAPWPVNWRPNSAPPEPRVAEALAVVAEAAVVVAEDVAARPLVDPGDYNVTVTVAGKSDSHTVKVEEDPRVQFSAEDRTKRRKAVETLIAMTKDADAGRRKAVAMTTALTNLTDSWKLPNAPQVPDAVRKAVDDLSARAKKVAAQFESPGGGRGFGGGAGRPPEYTPPPVTQKLARLMSSVDGYSAAPTTRQMNDLAECSAQLKKGLDEVNALWDEVPKLNKLLSDSGVQYFKVNLNTVPAAVPGGRGGGCGPQSAQLRLQRRRNHR